MTDFERMIKQFQEEQNKTKPPVIRAAAPVSGTKSSTLDKLNDISTTKNKTQTVSASDSNANKATVGSNWSIGKANDKLSTVQGFKKKTDNKTLVDYADEGLKKAQEVTGNFLTGESDTQWFKDNVTEPWVKPLGDALNWADKPIGTAEAARRIVAQASKDYVNTVDVNGITGIKGTKTTSGPMSNALGALGTAIGAYNWDTDQYYGLTDIQESKEAGRQELLGKTDNPYLKKAIDVGLNVADVMQDLAISQATAIPYLPMVGVTSGADYANQALNEGYTTEQAMQRAILGAGATYGIEQFGAIGGNAGSKYITNFAKSKIGTSLLEKLPQKAISYIGKFASSKAGTIIGDAVSEGAEEFAEYYAQALLDRIVLDKDTPTDIKEALYNAGMGAAAGGTFGIVNAGAGGFNSIVNRAKSPTKKTSNDMNKAVVDVEKEAATQMNEVAKAFKNGEITQSQGAELLNNIIKGQNEALGEIEKARQSIAQQEEIDNNKKANNDVPLTESDIEKASNGINNTIADIEKKTTTQMNEVAKAFKKGEITQSQGAELLNDIINSQNEAFGEVEKARQSIAQQEEIDNNKKANNDVPLTESDIEKASNGINNTIADIEKKTTTQMNEVAKAFRNGEITQSQGAELLNDIIKSQNEALGEVEKVKQSVAQQEEIDNNNKVNNDVPLNESDAERANLFEAEQMPDKAEQMANDVTTQQPVAQKRNGNIDDLPSNGNADVAAVSQSVKNIKDNFIKNIAETLSVSNSDRRIYLEPIANDAIREINNKGTVSNATADKLFNAAYENGMIENDEYYNTYKDLKDELRTNKLTLDSESRNSAEYGDMRNKYFETLNLSNSEGVPVDVKYAELSERYPELFSSEVINPLEQLEVMGEVAQGIAKSEATLDEFYGSYEGDFRAEARASFDAQIEAMVNTINEMDPVRRARFIQTIESNKLKANVQSGKATRDDVSKVVSASNVLSREKSNVQKEQMRQASEAHKNKMREQAKMHEQRLKEERAGYAEKIIEQRTKAMEAKEREALLEIARQLDSLRTTPENKALIDSVIGDVDLVSIGMSESGEYRLKALEDEYRMAFDGDDNFLPNKDLERKIERLKKRRISEMDIEDVRDIYDTLRGIRHGIKTQNATLSYEKSKQISDTALNVIDEIRSVSGRKEKTGPIEKAKDLYGIDSLTPKRFFEKISGWKDGETTQLYYQLEKGQTKMLDFQMKAENSFSEFIKKNTATMKKWSGKNAEMYDTKIVLPNGETLKITPAEKISLYLHSLNADNLRHIRDGGITVQNSKYKAKGDKQNAYARGATVKLQPKQVREIAASLTATEKEFADLAYKFFNETSKNAINETSLNLNGYEIATTDNYFPLNTNKNYTHRQFESLLRDGTIEGMGMLRDRSGATNPILLEDVIDVIGRQIDNVSKYYGMAAPIRDVSKIINYTAPSYTDSVKDSISQQWTSRANDYIEKLMTDLQSPKSSKSGIANFMGKLRGNIAQSVLAVNPSVTLSQAASYPTAAASLGWEALAKGLTKKVDRNIINKYTPLLWYRSKGNSSVELGDIAKDKSLAQKMPWVTNWIQMADVKTVEQLWGASEAHTEINFPELKPGTDEFYKQTAETFNRTIYDTQPNYTTLQRPDLLRHDDELAKSLTMFQTQRMQNYNIIAEAMGKAQAAKNNGAGIKEVAGIRAKAMSSILVSGVVITFMKTIAREGLINNFKNTKDEEGEFSPEKLIKNMTKEFLGNMSGNILFGSEVFDIAYSAFTGDKYYPTEISSLSVIMDFAEASVGLGEAIVDTTDNIKDFSENGEAIEGAKKGAYSLVKPIAKLTRITSQMSGMPLGNAEKLVLGLVGIASPEARAKYENVMNREKTKGTANSKAELSVAVDNIMKLDSDVKAEIMRLKAYPTATPTSFKYNKEDVKLNSYERNKYSRTREKAVSDTMTQILSNAEYAKLDDTSKAKIIEDVYDYATWKARKELGDYQSTTKWIANAIENDTIVKDVFARQSVFITESGKAQAVVKTVIEQASKMDVSGYSLTTLEKINNAGVTAQDWKYINNRIDAYTRAQRPDVLRGYGFTGDTLYNLMEEFVLSDKAKDAITVAQENGISKKVFIDGYEYAMNTTGSKAQRNALIAEYVEGLSITEKQKTMLYSWLEVFSKNGVTNDDVYGTDKKYSSSSTGGSANSSSKEFDNFIRYLNSMPKGNSSSISNMNYGQGITAASGSKQSGNGTSAKADINYALEVLMRAAKG